MRTDDGANSADRIANVGDTAAPPEAQAAYSTSGEPLREPKFCEPCEPQGE